MSSSAADRVRGVVQGVLAEVADDGERSIAKARFAVAVGLTTLWIVATAPLIVEGESTAVLVSIASGAATLVSGVMWLGLRRGRRITPRFGMLSILVDIFCGSITSVAILFAPPQDYSGIFHVVGFPILYIVVVAAGLRLSRRRAAVGIACAAAIIVSFYAIDLSRNAARTTEGPRSLVTAMMMLGAAGTLSIVVARRTRHVALRVAEQAVLAERARSLLGSYLPAAVADQAMKIDELRLGGSRVSVAVLFSDLRSFTSSSESADPADVVQQLNEYFECMVKHIEGQGGVVDKYIGDSIMAVFGIPTARADDAARAVKAAFQMQEALEGLNSKRAARGLPRLAHGIGVHYGPVIAGNIGTAQRAQYTVIGDTVNVAARLEAATKEHGTPVLLSSALVEASAPDRASVFAHALDNGGTPPLSPPHPIAVKGRLEMVTAFGFARFEGN